MLIVTAPAATKLLRPTAAIVSSYAGAHVISAGELSELIVQVHEALSRMLAKPPETPEITAKPAVPIRRSIQPDYLICLNDGKRFKSLKRHLRTRYGMTPDDYRAKWGLDADYPMVAPGYARERSTMAKQMGLGQQRRRKV